MPTGCVQHQADTTRAPTFHCTPVRRGLQLARNRAVTHRFAAVPARRDTVAPTMSLICPKCQSKMRSFERNGVTVEQCKQCRGVFLDRGELEHLIAAENRALGIEPRDPEPGQSERIPDYDAPRRPVSDERKRSERLFGDDRKSRNKQKKRKKTFLEEFFD